MIQVTDADLEELLLLEVASKRMSARIAEIKEACKTKGSFHTDRYVCAVVEQERHGIAGLRECEAALGIELLKKHDLLKVSRFLVVKVSELNTQNANV